MKVIAPFLLLTGVIWWYGLQSPEECNPSISYANPLSPSNSQAAFSIKSLPDNQNTNVSLMDRNSPTGKNSHPPKQGYPVDSILVIPVN